MRPTRAVNATALPSSNEKEGSGTNNRAVTSLAQYYAPGAMNEADDQSSQSASDASRMPMWLWLVFGAWAVFPWLAFAVAPASLSWSRFNSGSHFVFHERLAFVLYASCVLVFGLSLLVMFLTVFTREVWGRERTTELTIGQATAIVASGLGAILGCFATLYAQISSEHHDCFVIASDHRHVLRHAEAAYFAITTFTTTGLGDISPTSTACRLVVAGQTLVGLAILAVLIAGLTSRIVDYSSN